MLALLSLALAAAAAQATPLAESAAALAVLPATPAAEDLAPALRKALAEHRALLGALVREVAAQAPVDLGAKALEHLLVAALTAQGMTLGHADASAESRPGALREVHVEAPAGHPGLRAVTVRWQVPECGEDALLALLRFEGGAWRPVLEERSGRLQKISDGLGALSLVLSPPGPDGESLALAADYTPWCTSSWSTARYRIYRINPRGPAALLASEKGPVWIADDPFTLSSGPGWVQLEAFTWHLDLELHSRIRRLRYTLAGGGLRRIAPLSDTPRGFLAEWQSLPWKEASRWARPGLAGLHARLARGLRGNACRATFFERKVRAGAGEPRYRLGLSLEDGLAACALPPKLFFEVGLKDGAYFLSGAGEQPAAGDWQDDP